MQITIVYVMNHMRKHENNTRNWMFLEQNTVQIIWLPQKTSVVTDIA